MQLETLNKLYLELSQVATAQTAKEIELRTALKSANDCCRSMHAIVARGGDKTNWPAFRVQLDKALKAQHKLLFPPDNNGN